MPLVLWVTLALMPFAWLAGHLHKRRHGPTPMNTQLKRVGIVTAVLALWLLAACVFADTF